MATTTPPDQPDHRPSMRIRLATRLLDTGQNPTDVAAVCKVPIALLDFITEHRGTADLDPLPYP